LVEAVVATATVAEATVAEATVVVAPKAVPCSSTKIQSNHTTRRSRLFESSECDRSD